jgi:steroid delta-isomerase-like uncharacterized protein
MAETDNLALVRRYFDEVLNRVNLDIIDELFAPDYVLHAPGLSEPLRGVPAFKRFVRSYFDAFPDWQAQIEDEIASGDRVVVRGIGGGTHRGAFQGVAPTHKRVTATGIAIYRIAAGRIAEEWEIGDRLGLMQQLDAVKILRT